VVLLLLLPRRDRVAEARSLLGVTDVDRTGTLLTPHSSTGLERFEKARMKPLRCFVGVGDASDCGCDIVAVLGKWCRGDGKKRKDKGSREQVKKHGTNTRTEKADGKSGLFIFTFTFMTKRTISGEQRTLGPIRS
jgi:hypothetical protein